MKNSELKKKIAKHTLKTNIKCLIGLRWKVEKCTHVAWQYKIQSPIPSVNDPHSLSVIMCHTKTFYTFHALLDHTTMHLGCRKRHCCPGFSRISCAPTARIRLIRSLSPPALVKPLRISMWAEAQSHDLDGWTRERCSLVLPASRLKGTGAEGQTLRAIKSILENKKTGQFYHHEILIASVAWHGGGCESIYGKLALEVGSENTMGAQKLSVGVHI